MNNISLFIYKYRQFVLLRVATFLYKFRKTNRYFQCAQCCSWGLCFRSTKIDPINEINSLDPKEIYPYVYVRVKQSLLAGLVGP
jgi:hypothetical protein